MLLNLQSDRINYEYNEKSPIDISVLGIRLHMCHGLVASEIE